MRRALLTCICLALPVYGFAQGTLADCPASKADLKAGIYATSDGTETIRYRTDSLGHVLVEDFPKPDFTFSYLATTMFGLYHLQEGTYYLGEVMPVSLVNMAFAVPSGNLPEPTPDMAFHSPVKSSGELDPADAMFFVTVGGAVEKAFGDCTYETLPVTARRTDPDEDILVRYDYIPQLGIAVEWMFDRFNNTPPAIAKANLRLSLTAPEGMPAP